LGAGARGTDNYGAFAKLHPALLKIKAVAEPDRVKRERMQKEHGIPDEYARVSWEEAFDKLPPPDAVIIATQDRMHIGPVLAAINKNINILCEKPICPSLGECREVEKASANFGKVFVIAHELRYTRFFSKIKELLDSGRIGRLIGIELKENVGHIHMSHSFVRGNWRNSGESSPMILAKSCHDMDMLRWLAGAPWESLSSYGSLNFFKAENAPEGAPERCLEGCPHMTTCPWEVSKIYLTADTGWPTSVITTDLSVEGRMKALEEGRCVFRCDNNVADHQTVSLRFENNVTALFTMSGFTMPGHRCITLFGTAGEINGDMEEEYVRVKDFSSRNVDTVSIGKTAGGHSGGDTELLTDFVRMVRGEGGRGCSKASGAFESHYMAFAAEASRLAGGSLIRAGQVSL
jgi:predicted dehydrogenase